MKSIRLLPIVVMAASALLVLKVAGLATGGGYALTGLNAAMAQDATEEEAARFSSEQLAAAEAAAEALFSSTPTPAQQGGDPIRVLELDGTGNDSPMLSNAGETERVLLERLAERRAELDAYAAELEMRLAVVEAAETRIEERMTELADIERRINTRLDEQDAREAEQFGGLVAMYEAMRPADAALIFNDLDMAVLLRVSRMMNPRKLGPILAKMLPAKAQELTVRMANTDSQPAAAPVADGFGHLPQIMGQ